MLKPNYHNPIRLLIVEDNFNDQQLILEYLNLVSFRTTKTIVDSLFLSIKYLQSIDFDLIILDLNLPDSKGIDTVKRIREISEDIRIIILTGATMDTELLNRYKIKGHLSKMELSPTRLNYEMEIALGTNEIRKSRQNINRLTVKLGEIIEMQGKKLQ